MTDRNPMLQNLNNPVAGLGVVPGKGLLDDNEVHHRQKNARNPLKAAFCYPGGDDPLNHNVQVGDLLFGRRGQRDVESMDGEPNELVTASVAGLCWDEYPTHRAMEEDHYFVGVAQGDESIERPYDGGVDARGGHATIRVGTVSVINNGPKTFYPGDLVMWRFPNCGNTPGANFYNKLRSDGISDDIRSISVVDGGDPDNAGLNLRARFGEEITKFRPEIVPFNPADLSIELGGVYATMWLPREQGGISNIPFNNILPNSADYQAGSPLTLRQDEGMSYKQGISGICSAFIECAIRYGFLQAGPNLNNGILDNNTVNIQNANPTTEKVLKKMGAFSTSEKDQVPLMEAMTDIFMKHIGGCDSMQDQATERFYNAFVTYPYDAAVMTPDENNTKQIHARMRLNAVENITRGMAKTVDAHRKKIIGRCTSASAPGDTTDLLLGHTL